MAKTLTKDIEAFIANDKKVIEIKIDKNTKFAIEINEDVDVDVIHNVIEDIVAEVIKQDWSYNLIDILLSYWVISLFTDIEPPMVDEDIPDYKKCLKICYALDLINVLSSHSLIIMRNIESIQKNIWRKLELRKAEITLLPWEKLLDGLGEFYEILDTLEKYADMQKDVDIDNLAAQLSDVAESIAKIEELSEHDNSSDK